jgi:hypothetical protein
LTRVLFVMQSAFSLWMLVDAVQRRCSSYWYIVVLCPFGEWVYFFKVKIHDPELEWARAWFRYLTTRRTTTDQLRNRVARTPSFANVLALGQMLYNEQAHADALEQFRAALELQPDSADATYGAALSALELADFDAAVRDLRRVIDAEPAFRDYAAWLDLSEALGRAGRDDESLAVLERLVDRSPRLSHRMAYAQRLRESGRLPEAEAQLQQGLADFDDAPAFLRRRERGLARKARRMLARQDYRM